MALEFPPPPPALQVGRARTWGKSPGWGCVEGGRQSVSENWHPASLPFHPRTSGSFSCSPLPPSLPFPEVCLLESKKQMEREKNSAKIITGYNKSIGAV